ncbi:MAG TPA: class I SAM-dependent methyltransferase [Acidobacteriota bacterium]|nr:class I SAM-dependent methyltransferase [Acidobacteriota bacterium]
MYPHEYRTMRSVEDTHWWYRGLRTLVWQTLRSLGADAASCRILDAGCGTGGAMLEVNRHIPGAQLFGIDPSELAIGEARERHAGWLARASADKLPFGSECFDFVLSLDVLYIDGVDDQKALAESYRVLKRGGSVIVNVPAFEFLRGEHDRAISTARRYTRSGLQKMLSANGFSVQRLTYWNTTLFPIVAIWRPLSRLRSNNSTPVSDLKPLPKWMNGILSSLILTETKAAQSISLPIGSSVFGIARKS